MLYPPVAKLDIAVDSDSKGRGFESLRADQIKSAVNPCVSRDYGTFLFCFSVDKVGKSRLSAVNRWDGTRVLRDRCRNTRRLRTFFITNVHKSSFVLKILSISSCGILVVWYNKRNECLLIPFTKDSLRVHIAWEIGAFLGTRCYPKWW